VRRLAAALVHTGHRCSAPSNLIANDRPAIDSRALLSSILRVKIPEGDTMTVPKQVLTVVEVGDLGLPLWSSASADGERIALELSETQLWAGRCQVRSLRPKQWSLPEHSLLVVTDRRTTFLTTAFDKRGGWAGFGLAGLAMPPPPTRSASKRWQSEAPARWPLATCATSGARPSSCAGQGSDRPRVHLPPCHRSHWLVGTVAWQRLGLTAEAGAPGPRDPGVAELCRRAAEIRKAVRSTRWRLQGNPAHLISAASGASSTPPNSGAPRGAARSRLATHNHSYSSVEATTERQDTCQLV
jgi:hypothetical protein